LPSTKKIARDFPFFGPFAMKKGEANMLKLINYFPSFFLPCCHYHFSDCCRRPEFRDNVGETRGSTSVEYSVIIPLVGKTPFHLYTDSHLTIPKEGLRDGTRCYHLNSDVQIKIDQGGLLIFDGNLVHAGGDSTYPNPRIFASFGRTFKALESINYIGLCQPCDYPSQCDLCDTLENIRSNHEESHLIQGLDDGDVMYKCTGLESNGFVLEKIQIKATAAFDEELSNLDNSRAIKGISFQKMGQEKDK
jgi:hypothetical protein